MIDGNVGIGAIVCNNNGEVMLAMENHFSSTNFVELVEVIVMFNGISRAVETGISFLWIQTDSKSPGGELDTRIRFNLSSMLFQIFI